MAQQTEQNADVALLLIDLQNSFFHEDGGNYYKEAEQVLPAIRQLLRHARDLDIPILFVAERHRPGVVDFEQVKLPSHCVDAEFDSEFYSDLGPSGEHEFLVTKRRLSAFLGTDMDALLRELGVRTLVIGGVKANVCVRATVQDGFSLGYKCMVVREAVNSNRANLAEASFEDIDRYMGWVVSMEDALEVMG